MAKFWKKPVVIEAVQITCIDHNGRTPDGWPFRENPQWLINAIKTGVVRDRFVPNSDFCHIEIKTLEGAMFAGPGDWIIRGIKGELYPCKSDIFEQTYKLVKE